MGLERTDSAKKRKREEVDQPLQKVKEKNKTKEEKKKKKKEEKRKKKVEAARAVVATSKSGKKGERESQSEIMKALSSRKHKDRSSAASKKKEDGDEPPKVAAYKKVSAVTAKKAESSSSSKKSDYDEDEEEIVNMVSVETPKGNKDSNDTSSDDCSEEEKIDESSEESDSDEDDDDVPQNKKPKKKDDSTESSFEDSSDISEDDDPQTPATPEATTSKTLFVGNLAISVNRSDVENFFKDAGEVVDVCFSINEADQFMGFGNVEFATAEAAKKALELNGKELLNRELRLDLARERGAYIPKEGGNTYLMGGQGRSQTVFVRGFDKSLGEDEAKSALLLHFGSCGKIRWVSIPQDYKTCYPKGLAYLDFKHTESFNKALELNGVKLRDRYLTVEEAKPRCHVSQGRIYPISGYKYVPPCLPVFRVSPPFEKQLTKTDMQCLHIFLEDSNAFIVPLLPNSKKNNSKKNDSDKISIKLIILDEDGKSYNGTLECYENEKRRQYNPKMVFDLQYYVRSGWAEFIRASSIPVDNPRSTFVTFWVFINPNNNVLTLRLKVRILANITEKINRNTGEVVRQRHSHKTKGKKAGEPGRQENALRTKTTPVQIQQAADYKQLKKGAKEDFTLEEVQHILAKTRGVECCHFSSDGNLLAIGGFGRKAVLWSRETHKETFTRLSKAKLKHSKWITDVRFSPCVLRLATSSKETVRVWDPYVPGFPLCTFRGHSTMVRSIDFHPTKGDLLCSCDYDSETRYWDINDNSCARVLKSGAAQVRFQPCHGSNLAAATQNFVSIFDVETNLRRSKLEGHKRLVKSVCWDSYGEHLASVSDDLVRVWKVGSSGKGEFVCELSRPGNNPGYDFNTCIFHPTHPSLLVIGYNQFLALWNMTENKILTMHEHDNEVSSLAASSATGLIASGCHDDYVKLWNYK